MLARLSRMVSQALARSQGRSESEEGENWKWGGPCVIKQTGCGSGREKAREGEVGEK